MFYILPPKRGSLLEYREHFEEALDRAKRLGEGTEVYRLSDGALCATIVHWIAPKRER